MIMKTATIPVVCECVCVCVCVCVFCDYSSAHILLADAADKAACCEERSCRWSESDEYWGRANGEFVFLLSRLRICDAGINA